MKRYSLILSLILLFAMPVFAQEGNIITVEQKGELLKVIEFRVKKNTFYTSINPAFQATSMTIETAVDNTLERMYVLLGGIEKFIVKPNGHQAAEENQTDKTP